ncbi:calcium-binding protein [Alsobacter sp. R-9]
MASYTYSLNGGDQTPIGAILGKYDSEFRAAVQNAIGSLVDDTDADPNNANVDLQLFDQDGTDFDADGYGGAFVRDGQDFAGLEDAPILIFDDSASDGDGVSVTVDGDIEEQLVGLTTFGDKFIVKASDDDGDITVDGAGGNDTITTGRGDDLVFGGTGDDRISAGKGDDIVDAGKGNDSVSGGAGDDLLLGGDGNDTILGDSGDDEIWGGEGDDSIYGGVGNTTVYGGAGFDVAVIKANIAGFEFEDGAWTNGGNVITDVEYTKLNNGVLITVGTDQEADVARLFQLLTDKDPTAAQLHDALYSFNEGGLGLDAIAQQIDEAQPAGSQLGLDEALTDHSEIKSFVASLINNAFDADPWNNAQLENYVDDLISTYGDAIEKKLIVADLVTKLDAADEHIHIAVSGSSV